MGPASVGFICDLNPNINFELKFKMKWNNNNKNFAFKNDFC